MRISDWSSDVCSSDLAYCSAPFTKSILVQASGPSRWLFGTVTNSYIPFPAPKKTLLPPPFAVRLNENSALKTPDSLLNDLNDLIFPSLSRAMPFNVENHNLPSLSSWMTQMALAGTQLC